MMNIGYYRESHPTARRNRHVIKISDIPCVFQDMIPRMRLLFLTIVVYDKQKTALVDDPSDQINVDYLRAERQSTRVIRSLGSSTRVAFLFIKQSIQFLWKSQIPLVEAGLKSVEAGVQNYSKVIPGRDPTYHHIHNCNSRCLTGTAVTNGPFLNWSSPACWMWIFPSQNPI
jgi:hypothetical protein